MSLFGNSRELQQTIGESKKQRREAFVFTEEKRKLGGESRVVVAELLLDREKFFLPPAGV